MFTPAPAQTNPQQLSNTLHFGPHLPSTQAWEVLLCLGRGRPREDVPQAGAHVQRHRCRRAACDHLLPQGGVHLCAARPLCAARRALHVPRRPCLPTQDVLHIVSKSNAHWNPCVMQYGWEKVGYAVNESPAAFKHGGKLFLAYSASDYMTPDYAVGLLTFKVGETEWQSFAQH